MGVNVKHLRPIYWARKSVQLVSFLLFNGAFLGIMQSSIVLPILLSLGSSQKTVVSAIDAVQEMLAAPIVPWIPIAIFVLLAVLASRVTCGWICPFGFFVDIIAEINGNRKDVSPRTHAEALKFKYLVLGITLFVSGTLALTLMTGYGRGYKNALGSAASGPFSIVSPESTTVGVLPLVARKIYLYLIGVPPLANQFSPESVWLGLSSMTWLLAFRLMILIITILLSFFVMRSWCRYLCPAGAFLAIFSRHSLLGLTRNLTLCNRCGDCNKVCPMKIRITEQRWEKMTDPECIMCLECAEVCTLRAIRPKFA